ncbi:MAG TPA: alpha/beta fold hydrolase, partial [Longimicrobiales bacterium]
MRRTLLLFMLCALPGTLAAQSEAFVVRLGTDTIATETFTRSATRLEGELSGSGVRARSRYSLDLSNGHPVSLRSEVIPAGSDTATLKATLQFARDSVFVQLVRGGSAQPEQRLATRPGAVPFVNLAFSFVELVTTRETRTPGDSITAQLFLLENGATLPAKIKWITPDSAVMTLGGIDLRMHLDARGRILHAAVPAQNVTVTRVAGTLNRAAAAPPDYGAPANASYTAQDVTVSTPAGHTLAGTRTLPKARRGRIPAVVTISGSGAQDRDESLTGLRGYRPFRELAEDLAGRGIAVLRYDDRGFGGSTGVHASGTSADFADDTRAVIAYLRTRPEIDPDKIFLAGHSEGGMIAPMVAADDPRIGGIVLMAGPAYTGRRILEYQTRNNADLVTGRTQA